MCLSQHHAVLAGPMAAQNHVPKGTIIPKPLASTTTPTAAPVDPKDPDNFLRRCSGKNKKTRQRCSTSITRSQHDSHPKYLPTCKNHREQKTFAGRCRFHHPDGETCGRLFRWAPPLFELCSDHERHSDMPCYLLKLPLELRYEIFRYLLPSRPIGSSTATEHGCLDDEYDMTRSSLSKIEFADVGARLAAMPAELNENMRTLLLDVPQHQFGEIMRPHMHSVRQHCRKLNGSPHSCHRCLKYVGPHTVSFQPRFTTQYPMPIRNLFLVCRQIHQEAKELLYSTVAFTINVCRDGTFMCGRRLLEPRGPDGSSPTFADGTVQAKNRFLQTFDWAAVKNYNVDIVVENQPRLLPTGQTSLGWDEEVEIYDIRDYVAVVVSGILGKSRNLCKLQVRLCLDGFEYAVGKVLEDVKLLTGPFQRLRNVRQPRFTGVYHARAARNDTVVVIGPEKLQRSGVAICSVPLLPDQIPVLLPGIPEFDEYTAKWERCLSSAGRTAVIENPPIRAMFTEFKDWYSRLANIIRNISFRPGRQAFLHRARVAREQEDVEAFRKLRNELIQSWYDYLEQQEKIRNDMNVRMNRMLDADTYPSLQYLEETDCAVGEPSSASQPHHQSPGALSTEVMTQEGIPLTGNRSILIPLPNTDAEARCASSRYTGYPNRTTGQRYQAAQHGLNKHHMDASTSDTIPTPSATRPPALGTAVQSCIEPLQSQQRPLDDWAKMLACYDAGGPGPSTSQRWVSSGIAVEVNGPVDVYNDGDDARVGEREEEEGAQMVDERRDSGTYVGKGKGKMVVG